MKLKLSHSEFMALYAILKASPQYFKAMGKDCDMYDALLATIIASIFQKFYAKAIFKKKEYRIKLEPHEAIGFWLLYCDHEAEPGSFEGNLVSTICNNIHQQYQNVSE